MFKSFLISRLTATQRGLPQYGVLIESTMTGRTRRRAHRGAEESCARIACSRTPLAAGVR